MPDRRESRIFALTAAGAAALLVSIAGAETLLAIALTGWLVLRPRPAVWPDYVVPAAAFVLLTIVSLLMSPEPGVGVGTVVRKSVLFLMGLLAATFVTSPWRMRISHGALLAVAAVAAGIALVQFSVAYLRFLSTQNLSDDPTVLARITGLMGHWMTFSGEQLLVWCAATPAVLVLGRRWLIPLGFIGAALVLSFTRSVWLGAAAGFMVAATMLPRKIAVSVAVPVLVVALASSGLIYHRLSMSFGEQFAPDTGRYEMALAGIRMIQDHPWFGVGPERIAREFPKYYRGSQLANANFYYGHLHNNVIQIAAERGLLCLAAFFWFIFELYAGLAGMLKTAADDTRWAILSALAALTGFLVAGMFEYNFGDSEVLLLLLFIVSLPYGNRGRDRSQEADAAECAPADCAEAHFAG